MLTLQTTEGKTKTHEPLSLKTEDEARDKTTAKSTRA